jgi:mono/diheme cytochrome c family protein
MITRVVAISFALGLMAAGTLAAQQPVNAVPLFAKNCATCHGPKGAPSAAMAHSMGVPDFSNPATLAAIPDSVLRATVTNGKGRMMQAFRGRLKPEEIDALIVYIRSFSRH